MKWIDAMGGLTDARQPIGKSLDLQTVIDTIPVLVVCALPDGTVEFVNQGQNVLPDAQKGTVSLSPFDVSLVATP